MNAAKPTRAFRPSKHYKVFDPCVTSKSKGYGKEGDKFILHDSNGWNECGTPEAFLEYCEFIYDNNTRLVKRYNEMVDNVINELKVLEPHYEAMKKSKANPIQKAEIRNLVREAKQKLKSRISSLEYHKRRVYDLKHNEIPMWKEIIEEFKEA